jgi:triacylglycerol lipase
LIHIAMKFKLLPLFASLLGLGAAQARNSQPLRATKSTPAPIANPVGRVVLVHGFMENGSSFYFMQRRLEKLGYQCLVPKLRNNDGRGGLEHLAEGLKQDIDAAYGPTQPIHVIGFSMGGLVSRYYLQNLGGAARCSKFFTISSPHHGTHAAWLYPSKGVAQMRPGSDFLAQLASTESRLGAMPVVSCRTPLDLVILPTNSSVWHRAENLEYTVLFHPLMVSSGAVISDLTKRLAQ